SIVGFVHTVLDEDPVWGALLDNLHVAAARTGTGAGTQLMARAAAAVLTRAQRRRLYLWVLEQNAAAQAFYEARGGKPAGRKVSLAPGGGSIMALRYVWEDPSILIRSRVPVDPPPLGHEVEQVPQRVDRLAMPRVLARLRWLDFKRRGPYATGTL